MLRRFLAVLLIALALATAGVYAWAVMAPLTLSIGSGPMAFVTGGGFNNQFTGSTSQSFALTQASAAGTCLTLTLGSGSGSTPRIVSLPPGWQLLIQSIQGTQSDLEVWIYPNNPGGIQTVQFITSSASSAWYVYYEEDANVRAIAASALDVSGTATATAGTTLALSTTGPVSATGEFATAVWLQHLAAPAAVTFTTPTGWIRNLADSNAGNDHIDSESLTTGFTATPAAGSPLNVTLTSTGTSASAAGVIYVLKGNTPATDQTAYIAY